MVGKDTGPGIVLLAVGEIDVEVDVVEEGGVVEEEDLIDLIEEEISIEDLTHHLLKTHITDMIPVLNTVGQVPTPVPCQHNIMIEEDPHHILENHFPVHLAKDFQIEEEVQCMEKDPESTHLENIQALTTVHQNLLVEEEAVDTLQKEDQVATTALQLVHEENTHLLTLTHHEGESHPHHHVLLISTPVVETHVLMILA